MILHILERNGDDDRRIADRDRGLVHRGLAEVENADLGIIRESTAVATQIGLAVAVKVMPHRNAVAPARR